MNIKILVATHKEYQMPRDPIYLPIYVGKALNNKDIGYIGDNTGNNISKKNASFCELTALYWGWKNLECDYIGLAHYRRYFTMKKNLFLKKDKFKYVLSSGQIESLLSKYNVIVPKKRRYFIETLYSHYEHTHYKKHLDVTKKIIEEKYPEYIKSFDKVMRQRSGYMFNMYVMKKEFSDEYCEWLFDILFELEDRVGNAGLSGYQQRFYGRVSEIIFNCWLLYQKQKRTIFIKEINCLHIEKINWKVKMKSFLRAKFMHEKYERSF